MFNPFTKSQIIWLPILLLTVIFVISCGDDNDATTLIPAISSISPESGEYGDVVTITGTNLSDATSVSFNGTAATITSNTSTEIVTSVPDDASTGRITVITAGGTAVSTSSFTVEVVGAPTISSIAEFAAQAGDVITISGTELADIISASVGDVEATISNNTDTTVELTIGEGTTLGLSVVSVTTSGGTASTVVEDTPFYVIDLLDGAGDTFDRDTTVFTGGTADPEESTAFGWTGDPEGTLSTDAVAMPTPIDGNFFHMEGYSTEDLAGSYAAQIGGYAVPAGTWSDFFESTSPSDYYFNIQIHPGDLPDGYDQRIVGLRVRFDGGDARAEIQLSELTAAGYTADENGWYSLSFPVSELGGSGTMFTQAGTTWDDLPALDQFQRLAVVVRRNYGTGGSDGVQLTGAEGGVFYALSFDNIFISKGGPAYPLP